MTKALKKIQSKKNECLPNAIKDIRPCLEHYREKIPFAFVFGSLAEGLQTPLSDIDIAIFFHGLSEARKTKIEQQISMLFAEQVNILRLEDSHISPLVKLAALKGTPILISDTDLLNRFTLSILHEAEEIKKVLHRLRKAA